MSNLLCWVGGIFRLSNCPYFWVWKVHKCGLQEVTSVCITQWKSQSNLRPGCLTWFPHSEYYAMTVTDEMRLIDRNTISIFFTQCGRKPFSNVWKFCNKFIKMDLFRREHNWTQSAWASQLKSGLKDCQISIKGCKSMTTEQSVYCISVTRCEHVTFYPFSPQNNSADFHNECFLNWDSRRSDVNHLYDDEYCLVFQWRIAKQVVRGAIAYRLCSSCSTHVHACVTKFETKFLTIGKTVPWNDSHYRVWIFALDGYGTGPFRWKSAIWNRFFNKKLRIR